MIHYKVKSSIKKSCKVNDIEETHDTLHFTFNGEYNEKVYSVITGWSEFIIDTDIENYLVIYDITENKLKIIEREAIVFPVITDDILNFKYIYEE